MLGIIILKNISNYKLSDIYRSKNVYFSDDKRINKKEINQDKSLIKVFNKFIKKKYIQSI